VLAAAIYRGVAGVKAEVAMKWQAARARSPIWHPFAPSGIGPTMAADVGAPRQSDRTATRGSVEVMSRDEVMGCARWASAFAGKHKDHRYYELVEDTIQPDFVFRYFAIKDEDGSVRAVQPFFIIDQDLLLGTNTRLEG
jgi:hypothetical protein